MSYNITNIGKAEITKKWLKCNFNISADEFFNKFNDFIEEYLPLDVIRTAIEKPGSEIKIDKKHKDRIDDFFKKIKERQDSDVQMGFGAEESQEYGDSESMKTTGETSEKIEYRSFDTFDKETGKKEGKIILGTPGATGKLVPIEIIEKVETHFKYNEEKDIKKKRKTSGVFKISNPSNENKIWDIDVSFTKDKPASIDDTIHINSIEPNGEETFDYEMEEFEKPALKIHEFISTLNDENVVSYSLSLAEKNAVLFKVSAKNTMDYKLHDIKIQKEIPNGFMDVNILASSKGNAEITSDNLINWTIDKLNVDEEVELKVNMTIEILNTDDKPKTGKISAEYYADKALTGIDFDKFDAYSDNTVGIEVIQEDNNPDNYMCSVLFLNESDFQVKLVNLDVINEATQEKVIDIDPKEIPPIAAQGTWQSVEWLSSTENGEEPKFLKVVEFFLNSKRTISTLGQIEMEDIELAVAKMNGIVNYSIEAIPSFLVVPFNALLQVKNTGGAFLNELILEETVQKGYIPPKADEIELFSVPSTEESEKSTELSADEEIDWDNVGEPISINSNWIEISPDNQDPEVEHVIKINLKELKDSELGQIEPGTIIKAKYPIQA
ncbi:MAG: hypothetical protein ACTSVL_02520, partial [Promethearchaeota archaeon]